MTSLRILVTGSRTWTDVNALGEALYAAINDSGADEVTIVHGACPSGADQLAAEFCESEAEWFDGMGRELAEERHPADWGRHGKRAGFIRNQAMADLGADVCLAFIVDESRGAMHCSARAELAGIPVRYFRRSTKPVPKLRAPS